jgi:hypothetical protein
MYKIQICLQDGKVQETRILIFIIHVQTDLSAHTSWQGDSLIIHALYVRAQGAYCQWYLMLKAYVTIMPSHPVLQ